jgi:hypothetical protein
MAANVTPNQDQCLKVAECLRQYKFRGWFYERKFLNFEAPAETRFRTYFYSVAICHQTHKLHSRKLNLWGWEYIEHVFTQLGKNNSPFLQPGIIASIAFSDLCNRLASLFSDDCSPLNTTLDRLGERASFLAEADYILESHHKGRIENLVKSSKQLLVANGNGLYETLSNFKAYSDPMRKKSTFLLKLLQDAHLIKVKDPQNFVPIMDYHMQRVLLRTGCVDVHSSKLASKLRNHEPVDKDTVVRKACIEAFRIIARESGMPVVELNDFFWSLGRSCCHKNLLCETGKCEKDPCTFARIVEHDPHTSCSLESVCLGKENEEYRQLWQPVVETHYY